MKKVSLTGKVASDLIENIKETTYGKKMANGEIYQNPKEPKWICPPSYENEVIEMPLFQMEWLRPRVVESNRVILQLHGGGYIGVLRNAYRRVAVQYSKRLGKGFVLSPDYRVAPKHPFPAALEDAIDAYTWLLEEKKFDPKNIIVAGDSAGGGLALCLGQYLKDHKMPLPGGFILMSPWTDLSLTGNSIGTNFERDPLFGGSTESMIFDTSYRRFEDPRNPYMSPLYGDYEGFPPMLFQVGGYEMLLDDTRRVVKKAKKAGVKVRCHIYPGMFHVFQMGLGLLPESRAAWDEVGRYLEIMNQGRL